MDGMAAIWTRDTPWRQGHLLTAEAIKALGLSHPETPDSTCERWQISEATLERWRTESGGPLFLKLGNQVRYRLEDVEAFEEAALRGSTKIDDDADKTAKMHRTASQRMQASPPVSRPITIWLRTGPRNTRLRTVRALR